MDYTIQNAIRLWSITGYFKRRGKKIHDSPEKRTRKYKKLDRANYKIHIELINICKRAG